MNKYMASILALFLMQGATAAYARDVVPHVSISGGQVVTEYVENEPSGSVSMKKSTFSDLHLQGKYFPTHYHEM